RQRRSVSCAERRAAARAGRIARHAQAGRRAVQLEPARRQRGRLERRPLWRLSRSRFLAPLYDSRRLRRALTLLSPARPAARAAALAGERVAEVEARSSF